MKHIKLYTITEAIKEIKRMHDRSKNRPFLVGVHGPQHAGKTYFRKKANEQLHNKNLPMGSLDIYSITNPSFGYILERHYAELEYLFCEIGYNFITPMQLNIDLWNKQIEPCTGRPIDTNVIIFNPKFASPDIETLLETFDIVISNPDSEKK